jgi:hypothetical protein
MPGGNNYSTYYIKFEGETIIDGFAYKSIWRCDEEDQLNWNFYGYIREDNDHRVYLKPPDYDEGLIYDFGVSIGDTLQARNIYLNNDILNFIVTHIDSVQLGDGFKKRISLYEYINQKDEFWIEGLGSYFGILNSCNNAYGGACGGYEALCFEDNGVIVYQNPGYSDCYYAVNVGMDLNYTYSLRIYPNPAKEFVNIEVGENSDVEIEIFDLIGRKFFNKIYLDNKILLNLQMMDKGTYVMKVKSYDFSYPSVKLIVD